MVATKKVAKRTQAKRSRVSSVSKTRTASKPAAAARTTARPSKSRTGTDDVAGDLAVVSIDRRRRNRDGRRQAEDRRAHTEPVAVERRQLTRRAPVNRRRQIDPTTCERDYTNDEVEFMNALDEYKRRSGRMFPTCSEVLEVIRSLGYCKTIVSSDPAQEALLAETDPQENG